ncbi:MAG: hypothetical protein WAV40_00390 [Microgenomates group bacterium]
MKSKKAKRSKLKSSPVIVTFLIIIVLGLGYFIKQTYLTPKQDISINEIRSLNTADAADTDANLDASEAEFKDANTSPDTDDASAGKDDAELQLINNL